jgi:hypothetical protein
LLKKKTPYDRIISPIFHKLFPSLTQFPLVLLDWNIDAGTLVVALEDAKIVSDCVLAIEAFLTEELLQYSCMIW